MTKTRATTLLLVVLLLTFSVSAQEPPTSGQRLALYSKPAVVRVFGAYIAEFAFRDRSFRVSIGGVGSGFFLNPDGYIATNAHVVGEIQGGEEKARQSLAIEAVKQVGTAYLGDYRRLTSDQARDVLANLQLRSIKKINFVQLTNGDFLPYEIKAFGAPVGQGKDCAVLKIEAKNTPTLQIGDSTKVQLQDRIFAFGYPGAVDTLADFGVLDQKSRLEASITDGTVSALKNTNDGAPVLQVSVPITHGNSGGPALNEKGEVIGLATFGSISSDGQEVQGFNFLVPSSTLMEFVRQAGAQNISGTVDETYREGLELYWDRQYTAAIGKFNDVKLLYPPHSEVEQLISQASKFKAEGKEKSLFFSPILIIAVAAGGLIFLLLIVGVGILIIVKRPKATATDPKFAFPQQNPGSAAFVDRSGHATPPSVTPLAPNQPNEKTVAISNLAPNADPTVPISAVNFGTLTCTLGMLLGQRFTITPQGLTIGRQPGICQIVVPDGRVSSKHAWVRFEDGKLVLVDNISTNGTFLNDPSNRVSRVELKEGDVIIVAEAELCSLTFSKK